MTLISSDYGLNNYNEDIQQLQNLLSEVEFDDDPINIEIEPLFFIYDRAVRFYLQAQSEKVLLSQELNIKPFDSNLDSFKRRVHEDLMSVECKTPNTIRKEEECFIPLWKCFYNPAENLVVVNALDSSIQSLEKKSAWLSDLERLEPDKINDYQTSLCFGYNFYLHTFLEGLAARTTLLETLKTSKNFSYFPSDLMELIVNIDIKLTTLLLNLFYFLDQYKKLFKGKS